MSFTLISLLNFAILSQSFDLSIEKTPLIQDSTPLPLFTPDYSLAYTCHPSPGIYESSQRTSRTMEVYSKSSIYLEFSIKSSEKYLKTSIIPTKFHLNNESKTVQIEYSCIGTGWQTVELIVFDGEKEIKGHWLKYCGESLKSDLSLVALLAFAVVVVYFASFRARFLASWEPSIEDQADVVTVHHAYGFVIVGSGMLVLLYFFKDYLKYALELIISVAGAVSIVGVLDEINLGRRSRSINIPILGKLSQKLLISIIISITIITVYFFSKNWLISNLIATSYAYVMIKTIKIPDFKVGALLLSLVLLYDILWVYFSQYIFKENVMVSVASGLDLPIKLLFPHTAPNSLPNSCSMLGLGDLVLPGIFLAFSSRFDQINNSNYLPILIICYTLALIFCILILVIYQHAQPAMLYISPLLILGMLANAYKRQEIQKILQGIRPQTLIKAEELELKELD